jgi:hypothetical protein
MRAARGGQRGTLEEISSRLFELEAVRDEACRRLSGERVSGARARLLNGRRRA